jgi:hypothetical protein
MGAEENIWTKIEGVTVDWKILRDEEIYDLYSTPNIIRVIKS